MNGKIIRTENGFEHLAKQAERSQQAPQPQEFPAGKCTLVRVQLTSRDYFVPNYDIAPGKLPPFSILLPCAYSEILVDGKLIGIQKHECLEIAGLGVTVEIYQQPKWWAQRDNGSLL